MFAMAPMHRTNLDGMDLNLLRVLDALLMERHLTRAAQRVGLSQPATSHALARLRKHLGDPLFVRTPKGLEPTARCATLATPLREALELLTKSLMGSVPFEPATARRTFTIASADYGAFVLSPPLLETFSREAPGVDLWVRTFAGDPFEALALGDVDVAIGPMATMRPLVSLHAKMLYLERFVCLVRKDHPRVGDTLDLDTWVSLPHAFIAPRGTPGGIVDEVLASHGRARRVAFATPHFMVAPHVVASSDLVLTVAERVARAYAEVLPLRVLETPVPIPGFTMQLVWHERQHHDPAHQWFRKKVTEAATRR